MFLFLCRNSQAFGPEAHVEMVNKETTTKYIWSEELFLQNTDLSLKQINVTSFIKQNQLPPSYTDTELDGRQDEPFDSARQDYCVIPPLLPYPDEKDWEVPRENIVFVKVIGKGAFGQVAKGMVVGLDNSKESRLVAIKMLRGTLMYELGSLCW